MSKKYACYVVGTGQIVRQGQAPDLVPLSSVPLPGQAAISGNYDADSQYYDEVGESVIARPVMAATLDKETFTADGLQTAIISGIPEGTDAYINTSYERYHVVIDATGKLEITSDVPAVIVVTLKNFPFQVAVFVTEAV